MHCLEAICLWHEMKYHPQHRLLYIRIERILRIHSVVRFIFQRCPFVKGLLRWIYLPTVPFRVTNPRSVITPSIPGIVLCFSGHFHLGIVEVICFGPPILIWICAGLWWFICLRQFLQLRKESFFGSYFPIIFLPADLASHVNVFSNSRDALEFELLFPIFFFDQ